MLQKNLVLINPGFFFGLYIYKHTLVSFYKEEIIIFLQPI